MPTKPPATAPAPAPADEPALVHLMPTDHYIPGVPALESWVTPEEAARRLSFRPPAFVVVPPEAPATPAPSADPEV